jgi:O-antigen/teichoic acid export membrane protein
MISSYALIYLVAYVVPAAVSFFALVLYTHLLSPAEYGIYVIGAGIATIISAVAFTWVRHSVWRYQAASPHLDLRPEAAVAFSGTVLFIALLAPIALYVMRPGIGLGILAASALSALSLTAFDLSQEFKRAKLDPVRFTTIAVARSLVALGLGFAAIEWGGGGLGLLVAVSVSYLAGFVMNLWRDMPRRDSFSSSQLRQFARYGLPFTVGAVALAVHSSLDKLSVAYLLDQSAAGQYGLGANIARQLIDILAASVAAAMFPIVFRSFAQAGDAPTRERLKEGFELQFALIVPVAVWLAMSANVVTATLLGVEFQAGVAAILPLLAIGRILGATNQFYIQISFQLAEKPFLQVAHDGLTLTLNIALIFPLTRVFGLPGAAASVLIAEGVGILVGIWLSRRAFRLPFNGWGVARVLAATAVMAVVTYATQMAASGHGAWTLVAVASAGGLAYLAAVVALDVAGVRTSVAAALSLGAGGSRFSL